MTLFSFRRLNLTVLFVFISLFCSFIISAQDKDWRIISAEELSAKTPTVEPDADAEAMFWEVRIDDSGDDLSRKHYIRIKIFTERGREKYSKFDIPFSKGMKIKDLAARVIKPDGSIVEIKKEDIFEREIIKTSGIKIKAKSFAVPGIEPGVIVEYRYKEAIENAGAVGSRLQFQRDIPVQNLSYFYKPFNGNEPKYQSYNFADTKFIKDKGGFFVATRKNIPALKEEPKMPPQDTVQAWMLLTGTRISYAGSSGFAITFTIKDPSSPLLYWGAVSTDWSFLTKMMTKKSDEIKKVAEEVTAQAKTPDEKLRKLYAFCQTKIANTTYDPTLTDEQRAKLPQTKSLSDVLKRRSASTQFIDMLFGAMAASLGFDSRVALLGDRSEMFFDPNMTNDNFVHPGGIGIKVGDDWKVFNPGLRFLPYGMLAWNEEGSWAMLIGDNNYVWRQTAVTDEAHSQVIRTGKFNLLEDGTLEGDVSLEYTGQSALVYRIENYDEASNKRNDDLKNEVKQRNNLAEISNISFENVDDASLPLIKRYKVRIPHYAQKTGKRMFFQPGYFEYGVAPVFSSSTRKYDIFFGYPWSETDKIEITYPKNFSLDNADAPGVAADSRQLSSLEIKMRSNEVDNLLIYVRKFYFGRGGRTLYGAESYQPLKALFDAFHKSDTHTISLKQK